MSVFRIQTIKPKEVVDITEKIQEEIARSGKTNGFCVLFLKHTSAALTLAELDPGTDLDMLDAFEAMVPKLKYRHPHDPSHVSYHILSALIGVSVVVPFDEGVLQLGKWQRIVVVELNGPRDREVVMGTI